MAGELPLFKGDNYQSWEIKIELYFQELCLWKYLSERVQPPADKIKDKDPKDVKEALQKEQAKYEKKSLQAKAKLLRALGDYSLPFIRIDNAHAIWKAVKEQYRPVSNASYVAASAQLFSLQLQENGNLREHIVQLQNLQELLRLQKKEIPDEILASKLLSSLPPSYAMTVEALKAQESKDKPLTFAHVSAYLLDNALLKKTTTTLTPKNDDNNIQKALRSVVDLIRYPRRGARRFGRGRGGYRNSGDRRGNRYRDNRERDQDRDSKDSKDNRNRDDRDKDRDHRDNRNRKWCSHCRTSTHNTKDCYTLARKERAILAKLKQTFKEDAPTFALCSLGAAVSNEHKESWAIDSGATQHMTPHRHFFVKYTPLAKPIPVYLGDQHVVEAIGQGIVLQRTCYGDEPGVVPIIRVLHVPSLQLSLFSSTTAMKRGCAVVMKGISATISLNEKLLLRGTLESDDLIYLSCETVSEAEVEMDEHNIPKALVAKPKVTIELLHKRLGHYSYRKVADTVKNTIGLDFVGTVSNQPVCDSCVLGKQTRAPISKEPAEHRATRTNERAHMDLCGPFYHPSLNKSIYYLSFIDDCDRTADTAYLRHKHEGCAMVKDFVTYREASTGQKLRYLRCDRGGEFISDDLRSFLHEKGIELEYTASHSPHQNGVAEKFNLDIVSHARCIMLAANAPGYLWTEATRHIVHLRNVTSNKALDGMTPYEHANRSKPNLEHLRTWGCKAWVFDHGHKRKLDPRSTLCVYVGNDKNPGTYRLYNPETRKFIHSRDVVFDENAYYFAGRSRDINQEARLLVEPSADTVKRSEDSAMKATEPDKVTTDYKEGDIEDLMDTNDEQDEESEKEDSAILDRQGESLPTSPPDPISSPLIHHRPERNRKPPVRFAYLHKSDTLLPPEPKTIQEALAGPEAQFWRKAVFAEWNTLNGRKTFHQCSLPEGVTPIGCVWVFKRKLDEFGNVIRYKARLCAQGFTQEKGVDFDETFAPVARLSTIRALLAIAIKEGLEIYQVDVDSAYLYGEIDKEIYMMAPPGFDLKGDVLLLLKAIYGLKQAGKIWNTVLHKALIDAGFTVTTVDPCLYLYRLGDVVIIIAVYVDDIIIGCKPAQYEIIAGVLKKHFQIKEIGLAHWILGIQVIRDGNTLKLGQSSYLQSTLSAHGMIDCNPAYTPAAGEDNSMKIWRPDDDAQLLMKGDPAIYRSIVGRLNYAAISTRPDLSFAVSLASRFMAHPTQEAWLFLKRMLKYIKATQDFGIVSEISDIPLIAWTDSDWDSDRNDRRSVSGYICFLYGVPVSWYSHKQATVALSTMESEYMAVTEAAKEIIWLRRLLADLGLAQEGPTTLFVDNKAAIDLAHNPMHHSRTKHIDIKWHFIREQIDANIINLSHVASAENRADIMTKPLSRSKFENLRDQLLVKKF